MAVRKTELRDTTGWTRDEAGLPAFTCVPHRLPPPPPFLWSHLGSGRLHLLVDRFGRARLLGAAGNKLRLLASCRGSLPSTVFVTVAAAGERGVALLGTELPEGAITRHSWGCASVSFQGAIRLSPAPERRISFRIEFRSTGASFFRVDVVCTMDRGPSVPVELTVFAGLDGGPGGDSHPFCQDRTALLPESEPELGDFFLCGPLGWTAGHRRNLLFVRKQFEAFSEASPARGCLVFGLHPDCTVLRCEQFLEAVSGPDLEERQAAAFLARRPRAPELWMRHECTWAESRFMGFLGPWLPLPEHLPPHAAFPNPPAAPFSALRPAAPADPREALWAAFVLAEFAPQSAFALLEAAASQPRLHAIMASDSGDSTPPDHRRERSDPALLFLMTALWLAERNPEIPFLEQKLGGEAGPRLWDALERTADWLRDELRTGPHDLVRLLAGDWNAGLDAAGVEGRGESTLNTAQLLWALRRMSRFAWRLSRPLRAQRLEAWAESLETALAAVFDGAGFIRGFTDAGRPLGEPARGRVFADAQAWAVLARAGSPAQRQAALDSVLERCATEIGVAVAAPPFSMPPPPDVTTGMPPAGSGWNGGVSRVVTAWTVWALALEERADQGFQLWEKNSIRRRTPDVSPESGAPQDAGSAAFVNAPGAGPCPGLPDPRLLDENLPLFELQAFAWTAFSMRRLLEA